jgi:hypothetical protein
VPCKAFEVPVSNLETASLLLDVLAKYDAFQFVNKIKPDYCNAGGLIVFEDGGWIDWECPVSFGDFDTVRRDTALLAQAEAARAAHALNGRLM